MAGVGEVYVDGNITARVQTYDCLTERVPSLRVEFIEWDSGFRASGLRVGDRITAVNGTPVADLLQAAVARGAREELIGGWGEPRGPGSTAGGRGHAGRPDCPAPASPRRLGDGRRHRHAAGGTQLSECAEHADALAGRTR